ncbi:hypothetical protein IID21_04570 [Patescibacteria group bacterium]|nr:hypothetical protein [Patescibacteria group bacterium]
MSKIKPLRSSLKRYLKKHGLEKKFAKQAEFFEKNIRHPSLHTEILEPKGLRIYSFRIDKRYRAIFIYYKGEVEIIDINPHYE